MHDDDDDDLLLQDRPRHADGPEHRHLFRCTYCEAIVPRDIQPADLGLTSHNEIKKGAQYPYSGCWCGWGKFVVCEA
jgi:hypothetical protein